MTLTVETLDLFSNDNTLFILNLFSFSFFGKSRCWIFFFFSFGYTTSCNCNFSQLENCKYMLIFSYFTNLFSLKLRSRNFFVTIPSWNCNFNVLCFSQLENGKYMLIFSFVYHFICWGVSKVGPFFSYVTLSRLLVRTTPAVSLSFHPYVEKKIYSLLTF